jgi:N-ethylmaleimide reductase
MLFTSTKLGALELPNRAVMAPMTRSRAGAGGVPTPLAVTYYTQRASAALIITEGTQPTPQGQGYPNTPGLHTTAQVAAWLRVTDAVHQAGGRIFAQILHTGRIGHPDNSGHEQVAPSPIKASGQVFTSSGPEEFGVPRELSTGEVHATVRDFAAAARNAIAAGFDGVELHGANGYLIHQFLSGKTNERTDAYGGPVANRIRFAAEVASAVAEAIGADRVGLRLSPGRAFNDMSEPDAADVYPALVDALPALAYLHLIAGQDIMGRDGDLNDELRRRWAGFLIVNSSRPDPVDHETVNGWFARGADAISFGRAWLANPDLLHRLRTGSPLNQADPATFYGGDHTGYTDYPTLQPEVSQVPQG